MKKIYLSLFITTVIIFLGSVTSLLPFALLAMIAVTVLIIEVADFLPTIERDGFHNSHFHTKSM